MSFRGAEGDEESSSYALTARPTRKILRSAQNDMEVRAVLVTPSLTDSDREALEAGGVEVRKPASKRIAGLYEAAIQARKDHPRLPLIVSASEHTLRKFEQKYPPLVDIPAPNATAASVLATLTNL